VLDGKVGDAKVVGSCEGGTKEITCTRKQAGCARRAPRTWSAATAAADCSGWRHAIMKSAGSLLPENEGLRRAVQWLATQTSWDAQVIEEASRRFDLSPIDEEFLLRHFRDAGHDSEGPIA
jgi:hypothetical protein